MGLEKAQEQIDTWFSENGQNYWKPLEMMARLTEETGELARELNDRFGPKKKKPEDQTREVGHELADIIVTVCCMANSMNIDLDKAFEETMDKLYSRDSKRFKKD